MYVFFLQIFPFLHRGRPWNQDSIRVCNLLIAQGQEDAAYRLFKEMPKPTIEDTDTVTFGRFLLRAMARFAAVS